MTRLPFFALIERNLKHKDGSLNRGRHLRVTLEQTGFKITDVSASYNNSSTTERVQNTVAGYVQWIESRPLFHQTVELGWLDQEILEGIVAGLK